MKESGPVNGAWVAGDKWGERLQRSLAHPTAVTHFFLMALVATVAFLFLSTTSNPNIALSYDEAEFVGAARDYLETGRFLESTHSQSLGAIRVMGLPALIALTASLLNTSPHLAALHLNLAAGLLIPLLVYFFVWRVTNNVAWSLWSGLFSASHWQLVYMSSRAMSDSVYVCLFILLALLSVSQFTKVKSHSPLILGGLGGLMVAAMYLLRISAIFLFPGLPIFWLLLNARLRNWPWPRLLLAIALFVLLATSAMVAVSWRFHQINGTWTISPEIAFNARMADFRAGMDNEAWTLDETGELGIRKPGPGRQESRADALTRQARSLARNFLDNSLAIIQLVTVREAVPGWHWWALLVLSLVVLADGGWRWRARGGHSKHGALAAARALAVVAALGALLAVGRTNFVLLLLFLLVGTWHVLWRPPVKNGGEAQTWPTWSGLGLLVAGGFCVMHLGAYSFSGSQIRYMAQTYPLLLVCLTGCLGLVFLRTSLSFPLDALVGKNGQGDAEGRSWTGLALLLTVVILSDALLMQAKQTWQEARKKQAISAQSPSAVRQAGELIRQLSLGKEGPVRVAVDDAGVAYYAHGQGYILPYLETRPDRLLAYLARNRIGYVASPAYTSFGRLFSGIGLHHLMAALAAGGHPAVQAHAKGLVHQLDSGLSLRLTEEGEGFPGQGVAIDPAKGHQLLWLRLAGKPLGAKGYKRVSQEPVSMLVLRGAGREVEPAANGLCLGPSLTDGTSAAGDRETMAVHYYQVLKPPPDDGAGRGAWRVFLSPKAPGDMRPVAYSLYAIVAHGEETVR